jgi:hypothetical protein
MRQRRAGAESKRAASGSASSASSASASLVAASSEGWLERAGSVGRGAAAAAALGAFTAAAAGLGGGLLYDDRALVVENQDLRPSSAWSALITHDFWGTPLDDPRSHTSWRPVTVATLKLNFHVHELAPLGYHAVNLALHACVCAMVVLVAHRCGIGGQRWQPSALCGLLFAVHPVHGACTCLLMSAA